MSTAVVASPILCAPRCIARRGTVAALAIEPLHLLGLFASVLVFSGWLATVAGVLPVLAVIFFVLLMGSAYYLGRLVLHLIPLAYHLTRSLPLILLTGSLSWALVMLALHSLLPGSLRWHTAILFGLSAAGQWAIHRREATAREEPAPRG